MTTAARRSIGALALLPPLSRRTRSQLRGRVGVAYCHYVGEPASYEADFDAGLTLTRFDSLLAQLAEEFRFAPLEEVLAGAEATAKPSLAITFDDGFDLIRSGIADLLERYGIQATSFVIEGTVGNEQLMWRHKLSATRALARPDADLPADLLQTSMLWPMAEKDELADRLWSAAGLPPLAQYLAEQSPYFTWDGLREWIDRGHTIGLHTRTHPVCSRLTRDLVEEELEQPAARLRSRFELEFLPLSYPFGIRLDAATERELVESGVVDAAFGIEGFSPRVTPRHRLERASLESAARFDVFGRALLGLPR